MNKLEEDLNKLYDLRSNVLYVVIPCYNEEEVLIETSKQLLEKIDNLIINNRISEISKILLVDDGSTDKTWIIIEELHKKHGNISGLKLSRNRGHQNALFAGLMESSEYADIIISMDADLQDDIQTIDKMLDKYNEGYDIVYGVRGKRDNDTFFKRFTAESFYKLVNKIGGELIYNHADFRLMSKRSVEALSQFKEVNLFLRGLVPIIGYPSTSVMYERNERFAGNSKYSINKMLSFALEGITSLSIKPIRIITSLGFIVFTISIIMLVYIFIRYLNGATVTGWASIAVSIWFIGGLQIISFGVVGEYIGKIYLETKERPRYIIEKFVQK